MRKFSLVGFNNAFNTIRLYKRLFGVQTVVLSGNHKTNKSVVLFRLFTQTKEAPKKTNRLSRVTNTYTYKEKVEKDDSE